MVFLPWIFFAANSCLRARTMHKKQFPSLRAHHLPPPPPPNLIKPPPAAHAPPPPMTYYEGTCGACVFTGFLGSHCSPYFCSACEIKKIIMPARHLPLPRLSILIIPPRRPRPPSPNDLQRRADVAPSSNDRTKAGHRDVIYYLLFHFILIIA